MGKALEVLEPRNMELGPVSPGSEGPWKHWKVARDEDGVAWVVIDKQGASANTLSEDVLVELADVIEKLERDLPKGVVLRSAKRSGFIAGADIGEFRGMTDVAAIEERLTKAHTVVDWLDRLKVPTVAVIHGYCLGGGLEIALACDYRIAIDDARFGLPEVMLGLHPGLGGTVRLPRLINPVEAMSMMLTGRNVRAGRARSLGLVDAVVPERHVKAAAQAAVTGKLKTRRGGMLIQLINSTPGRKLLAKRMRSETAKRATLEHYPAPYALIDLWETHGGDAAAMQKAEIASFAKLMVTDTSRNLVRVFFLRDKLKGMADGEWSGQRVHVIGAGAMGGDIAAWCAWHGFTVSLADMKPEPLAKAIERAADLYGKIGHKRIDIRNALDRLIPDLTGEGVRTADLVIEAVPETLELKRKVYAAIEPKMRPDAILATNTSSIPLEQLRTGLARPQQLVGIHFFNPVSRMQLVEVVSHDQVAADVLAKARAFLGRIDRLPAPVKSAPGFLVNRALTPYMLEAMLMLIEGKKRETIDAAAVSFGMPMGPVELADQVGLDICLHVAETLKASLDRPMPDVSHWLKKKVDSGELGLKTGKGFYDWKNGKAVKDRDAPKPTDDMTDRLILPMIDVGVGCLREGVVADEETVDGAMIFATGFAPFRGGPLHYAKSRGVAEVRQMLWQFSERYGERFRPDPGWDRLA
jgi:3-hydroxyacyl-CoA dehydrogenase/enoyl-CoA hydratase/3-hydroxybutyryl-CoA epimerase